MAGIFITLEEPTEPMGQKAIGAGFHEPENLPGNRYPKAGSWRSSNSSTAPSKLSDNPVP